MGYLARHAFRQGRSYVYLPSVSTRLTPRDLITKALKDIHVALGLREAQWMTKSLNSHLQPCKKKGSSIAVFTHCYGDQRRNCSSTFDEDATVCGQHLH